ncbi:MAG: T9SS type A sorting domain-containing protein [Flavobacteriales bacterium]|jgi:hypothetical protein|nr:T9SS type A sorting domain-containing protein [Flavobacteriales bacterium]
MASITHAQYIQPDYYGDEHQGATVIRENQGQVYGTDGHQRNDVAAYFEGAPLGLYLRDSSRVSFTYSLIYNDSAVADTTYRVDMAVGATKHIKPDLYEDVPGVSNYYRGRSAVEQVRAYRRGIYEDVLERIDLHLYGSSGGPRMAFVVRPDGDPGNIKLIFSGQDSLGIDWQGALKVYMQDKWIKLEQAVAYQVAPNGSIQAVGWTADYEIDQSNTVVHFGFDQYDPDMPLVLQIGYGALQMGGSDTRDMGWSTYVGGTGDDEFTCVETDEEGNAYSCGHTLATNFPVAPGNAHYPPFQPAAAGYDNAVIMKFNGTSKRVEWATYYGGAVANPANDPEQEARTEARKLAVYTGNDQERQYVFATGVTNCTDFEPFRRPGTVFNGAYQDNYLGGRSRMWVGAFLKEDGTRDWATTHGQGNGQYNSREEGLAIAINTSGQLAVGGRLHRTVNYVVTDPAFPVVTPSGAYDHGGHTGGAFLMSFNADYTIRWATTLGNYDEVAYTQLTDLRYEQTGRWLWFTGISSGASSTLDLVFPTGCYASMAGSVMIGEFNMVTGPSLDYCTRWGGGPSQDPASIAYGLDFDGKYMWVVGGTRRSALSLEDAPLPQGPSTIHHSLVNASDPGLGNPCDGFILKFEPISHTLVYGTLIGGNKYDMLLDVGHDGQNVYIAGETRSTNGLATDLDPLRYFQPLNPNVNTRNAVILGIRAGNAPPEMVWRTPYGGVRSERAWGIAGSTAQPSEVYLAGATSSSMLQVFPLKEFSTSSMLDYYQNINLSGVGASGSLCSWYRFEWGLDFETGTLGFASPEASHQGTDAFIASFAAYHPIGIDETALTQEGGLSVLPLAGYASWSVRFPHAGKWSLDVYDVTGRQVSHTQTGSRTMEFDLGTAAPGIYMVRATDNSGTALGTKVLRP